MRVNIYILAEEAYQNTVWYRETVDGILNKAASLKYKAVFLKEEDLSSDIPLLLLIGTTPAWAEKTVHIAAEMGIRSVVVSCSFDRAHAHASHVLIDHSDAVTMGMEYLRGCGRDRIALYAINKNSYADMVKATFFQEKDIFYSEGSAALSACFDRFYARRDAYDAVLCSNYISAVSLMARLKENKVDLPTSLYIMTFGDAVLCNRMSPSVTSITLEHGALGTQAVLLYKYLLGQDADIRARVSVPARILLGESTEKRPYQAPARTAVLPTAENTFLCDEETASIQALEKALRRMEAIDFDMIAGMLAGKSQLQLSEELYTSTGTLSYRLRRLLKESGLPSADALLSLFVRYIGE